MFDDDDDEECLPIPRRSLIDRYQIHELSPSDRRQSRLSLNNSFNADESIPTPKQLISLYEKTIELAAKNQINIKNAFQIPLVERLPEVLDLIAFNDHLHSDPNFVKVGSIIDTSAKIYGLRVDALHTETQKLNGSIHPQEDHLSSSPTKSTKKPVQFCKPKSNSYIVSDLSSISIPDRFQFHPLQPSNMCQWPGGIGFDSIYADMVSYTMYSSSDYLLFNGFVDLNSRVNMEYIDGENILDRTAKTMCDLIPLREVIKESEDENHLLGCQLLREFTFNEESTESYIETIDECSMMESFNQEDEQHILSDLRRDEPTSFYVQELQSTYTCPMTMPSVDVTLLPHRMSFVDQIPYLLREKTQPSDYTYFDTTKLKLFAGPYVWKYTNLLLDSTKPLSSVVKSTSSIRQFKIQYSDRSIAELLSLHSQSKSINKNKRKRTRLSSISNHSHQLRLTRKSCPLIDLITSNNFSDLFWENSFDQPNEDFIDIDHDNIIPDCLDQPIFEYDFIRPVHYEKIEFEPNLSKIDTKKLQHNLSKEYQIQSTKISSTPIPFSKLCLNLIERNLLTLDKSELISAFYCMLNNCNRKHLFMQTNVQHDDLIIQTQPFYQPISLSYSHRIFL